ncbi:MAG: DNA polymerase I [Rickettsiales bacterium]|nr:DNA polymerase I [Rickettsiales bacterium]
MSKKIALIDGYGFVFRAYHSLPPLTRNDGTPVGAVFGFTNMLIKLLASLDVSHVAVVFDSGSKTFRNEIFPEYKANRPPCPEDLIPQFPIVREAAESLNIAILEKIGFEADDIIATLAKKHSAEGNSVLIVSSDKDLMQLVDDKVLMYDAMKNKMITAKEVEEKFFVTPNKVLDVLSLMGDSSDNVAGVKGIGPKTAAELINQFGNLENIFTNLDQIKQEKRRKILEEGVESAKLAKQLISLREDVELGISDEDLKVKNIEPSKLISFLENQGFRSLVLRVQKEFGISENVTTNSTTVTNKNYKAEKSFKDIKKSKITSLETLDKLSVDAALNGFVTIDYYKKNESLNLVTISTCKINATPEEIFYFEVENTDKIKADKSSSTSFDLFSFSEEKQETKSENNHSFQLDVLNKILFDDSIKKIFFNSKEFLKILNSPQKIIYEDISLINHLITSSIKNNLFEIIEVNLDENLDELGFSTIFSELEKAKEGKKFNEEIFSDENKKFDFFAFRNFALWQIYKNFSPRIFDLELNFAYHSFELTLLAVLAKMENAGIKIDVKKLKDLSTDFDSKIKNLTKEIYEIAGEEFNIASTQQLSKILFEKLDLTSSKKSKKTGALSTKSSVLEELEFEGHEIARKILEFRKFSKLKNTYTDALPEEINSKTGRIHSHFSTTSTITGRFNSTNPNLQNIPIKSLEGQKIREAFVASDGKLLISADYSQIELRVIAHVAKIANLTKAFKDGKDIHRITASQVLGISENEVTDEMRSKAKAINFGIIYGISAFGLAKQLKISRQEAANYIKSYLETYPGIDSYMKEYIETARKLGYVKTLSGRKCFIHEINNKNPMIRAEAERLSINAPIQGSAADIIKKAMINLDKALIKENLQSKIILQIHDELIIEAPENEVEIATKIIKREMENAVILDTPLKVDIKAQKCWE